MPKIKELIMTKRIIALALICVMCLGLFACSSKEADLYNKYKDIIDALEEEDYQSAYLAMVELANKGETDENGEETKDPEIEELKASAVGTWIPTLSSVEQYQSVSFELTEDGNFVMGDETYPLEVSYEDKNSISYRAKDGDTRVYSISISVEDNGELRVSLSKYQDENSSSHIGYYYLESQYTKIELTAENFDEYFEDLPEYVETSENSFGEITSFNVYRDKVVKESVGEVNNELSKVALEYSYVSTNYKYTADVANGTYELGEESEYSEPSEDTSTTEMSNWNGPDDDRYGFCFSSMYIGSEEGNVYVRSDFGIVRIQGTIYAFNGK